MTELEAMITQSARLSERSRAIYTANIRAFVAFAGDDPSGWTGAAVEAWRDKLRASRKSPTTVNLYLNAVRYASRRRAERSNDPHLDFARYAELLPINNTKKKRIALSLEQSRALVAACYGGADIDLRDRAVVVLALRTGIRRAGICALNIEDLRGRTLTVRLKGGRDIDIVLDDEAHVTLKAWLALLRARGITTGPIFRGFARPDLKGNHGLRDGLTPDGLYQVLCRRGTAAGLTNFHPHLLRHTFVSLAVQAGVPSWRIRQVTGQKSDAIIDLYTTDLQAAKNPVASAIPTMHGPSASSSDSDEEG